MEFQANNNEMKWNKYNKLDEEKFIDLAQRSTVIDDIVNQNMCSIKSKLYFFLPYHLKHRHRSMEVIKVKNYTVYNR